MAKLRIEPRDGSAYDLPLGTDDVTIGRGVSNTLHFRDPWLSRLHAEVVWQDGGHVLRDAESRNGTYLNGHRLSESQPLRAGDQVALGNVVIHYLPDADTGADGSFEMPDSEVALSPTGTLMISSNELQLERYRRAVRERSDEDSGAGLLLASLNEVAAALIAHYPLGELAERLLDLVLQSVPAQRGALLLRSKRGAGPLEVVTRRRYDDESQVRISRTILDVAVNERQAILTVDAQRDQRFVQAESIMMQGIRSVLCVPIINNEGVVIGLVYLDHRIANEDFNEASLRLVGLIASLAAVKIENCWLLEDQNEKRRMEEQLAVGAQIQRGLLPATAPKIDGYDLAGHNSSCFEIGGDYYDFVPKEDGKLALVIADISGKGVAAALLMAVLQASLRALVHTVADPAELMRRLNRALVENSPNNRFASVFYAEFDPASHTLEYVSGGHNPCLLWTPDDGVTTLDSSGPFIGLIPNAEYTSRVVDLAVGSTLLLYTDGVTELLADEGEEFGVEPLVSVLEASGGTSAHDVIDRVHDRMHAYVGSDSFDDDSTLVVLRRVADTIL